ncbi:MAG TPA: hypothetical protein VLZ83_11745 [Edaphocola sp.]|nr:hypothetical protein [Edaphocola sp.]
MKNLLDFKLTKSESRNVFGGSNYLEYDDGHTHYQTHAKSDKDKTGPTWKDRVD